ncbi:unnamed protein product [Clonostachys rhizophaga]|uniref:Uncharacterized protein n=1 Tax=Clonostachys rhizophaga TaxID=160324 RepID=A0A9N9YGZ2_9HYPO|nr:unnamed protein product [Clonostachys rhizophaga]
MTVRGDGDDGPNDAMLLQAGRRAPSHMLAPPSGPSGGEVSRALRAFVDTHVRGKVVQGGEGQHLRSEAVR